MVEGEDDSQKIEELIQWWLDDVCKKGDVVKFQEIFGWFILVFGLVLIGFLLLFMVSNMVDIMQVYFVWVYEFLMNL